MDEDCRDLSGNQALSKASSAVPLNGVAEAMDHESVVPDRNG
jgi:hypothetical protein